MSLPNNTLMAEVVRTIPKLVSCFDSTAEAHKALRHICKEVCAAFDSHHKSTLYIAFDELEAESADDAAAKLAERHAQCRYATTLQLRAYPELEEADAQRARHFVESYLCAPAVADRLSQLMTLEIVGEGVSISPEQMAQLLKRLPRLTHLDTVLHLGSPDTIVMQHSLVQTRCCQSLRCVTFRIEATLNERLVDAINDLTQGAPNIEHMAVLCGLRRGVLGQDHLQALSQLRWLETLALGCERVECTSAAPVWASDESPLDEPPPVSQDSQQFQHSPRLVAIPDNGTTLFPRLHTLLMGHAATGGEEWEVDDACLLRASSLTTIDAASALPAAAPCLNNWRGFKAVVGDMHAAVSLCKRFQATAKGWALKVDHGPQDSAAIPAAGTLAGVHNLYVGVTQANMTAAALSSLAGAAPKVERLTLVMLDAQASARLSSTSQLADYMRQLKSLRVVHAVAGPKHP